MSASELIAPEDPECSLLIKRVAVHPDGRFLSYLHRYLPEEMVCTYEIGEWTEPPFGKLFAYAPHLESYEIPYFDWQDEALLLCEARDVSLFAENDPVPDLAKSPVPDLVGGDGFVEVAKIFWKHGEIVGPRIWPSGPVRHASVLRPLFAVPRKRISAHSSLREVMKALHRVRAGRTT